MSKKMYTNTNKNGKADTLQFFFALCKLHFLPLETELLVQVLLNAASCSVAIEILKQDPEKKDGEGKNKEKGVE